VLDPLHIGQNVKEVLDCDLAAEMSARACKVVPPSSRPLSRILEMAFAHLNGRTARRC